MDFILNGQAHGSVANVLMANNFSPMALRPFIGNDGRSYIDVLENGKLKTVPSTNAAATLRKDEWKILDEAIVRASKPRLRAFSDLRSANLQFVVPNGMGKTVLETETLSDIDPATVDMDGLTQSQGDRPHSDLGSIPLPITHKGFSYSARQIAASRNGNTPLDTTSAELASRRVAEEVEKLTVGSTSFAYGGGTVQGYANYTGRLTRTIANPTLGGWTPAATVRDVLAMKNQSQLDFHYGPWFCYCSPNWDNYMDDDYSAAKGDLTLRKRIGLIQGVDEPVTLDYLSNYDLILVQKTTDVARAIVGMELVPVQWESMGGLQVNFKIMAILVPQLRKDYNGNTGIVHGSV